MKRILPLFLCAALVLTACGIGGESSAPAIEPTPEINTETPAPEVDDGITDISLSDDGISVEGSPISTEASSEVYAANDIVFYLAGQGFTYGEGTEADEHEQSEADAHTVVHITAPGTYRVSGSLSAGQIAIDLGEDAEDDPSAVVTLILDGVDISCSVAPAIIFYNVYECGSSDLESAVKDVDTTAAGANVIIADGSVNTVSGSYVARIYKSVELSEDGTEVIDSKKLHKYDGAFYSKMSMNIFGGEDGSGILNINAENEGLDSELHLTINGGNINIVSGNDGINTNEDGISVTTINGGSVNIVVDGSTGEGDGIDSNGWLVINGGCVTASACAFSGDAGIDSDMGIHINGGTVIATGNMLDRIEDGGQTHAVFTFGTQQSGGSYTLKNAEGTEVVSCAPVNGFTIMVISSPELIPGSYTFWNGDTQLAAAPGMMGGMMGGMGGPGGRGEIPEDIEIPEGMEGITPPEGTERPEGMEDMAPPEGTEGMTPPEGMEEMTPPEDMEIPEGMEGTPPEGMQGGQRPGGMGGDPGNAEYSTELIINEGANYFSVNEVK